MSLREIAARTGTSHALLRYHFGSLPGVLAAILGAQRARDYEALLEVADQGTFDDLVLAIWRAYTRPEQRSRVRAFFHVVGLAAYRPEEFCDFIASLDDLTGTLAALAVREGLGAEEASTLATVTVAAMRGLLLREILTPTTYPDDAVALILRMSRDRSAPRTHPGP